MRLMPRKPDPPVTSTFILPPPYSAAGASGSAGAIGGGMLEASLGADAGNVLIKTTAILGAVFLINTLVLARLTSTVNSRSLMAREAEPVAEQAPALPMAAPELPASAPAAAPEAPALPAAPAK